MGGVGHYVNRSVCVYICVKVYVGMLCENVKFKSFIVRCTEQHTVRLSELGGVGHNVNRFAFRHCQGKWPHTG